MTSSSSYYFLTTETPNINGGRPKGQFTIKSIHKAMSTNRLSTITLKLMKFSLLRVHHLSHSPLHFAEFTIHKGAPRPSPTGPVHRGTPVTTSPHFTTTHQIPGASFALWVHTRPSLLFPPPRHCSLLARHLNPRPRDRHPPALGSTWNLPKQMSCSVQVFWAQQSG